VTGTQPERLPDKTYTQGTTHVKNRSINALNAAEKRQSHSWVAFDINPVNSLRVDCSSEQQSSEHLRRLG
jgi:hypothetical protein